MSEKNKLNEDWWDKNPMTYEDWDLPEDDRSLKNEEKFKRIIGNIMRSNPIHGNNMELIDLIEFKLPNKDDHSVKLSKIFKKTSELIKSHNPDLIAIEAPFFGKNVQSMLKLGRAQGVSMAAALQFHYIPNIKKFT